MAHHNHGPLLRERSWSRIRERLYARPRRDPSPDAVAIVGIRGRPAQQENIFFQGAARDVHQNIIQQNINLAPHVRGVRRRRSRPVLLAADDDYDDDDDQWNYARDQRGGPRSRLADQSRWYLGYYEEDGYDTDKVIGYEQKARGVMKWRKEAKEDQEREWALAERNEFFARRDDASPAQSRYRAAEDIRRELKECDDDLKRCYEEAARDAQFRGLVVELENARRKRDEAEKPKKQLKSILVKKKLRFE